MEELESLAVEEVAAEETATEAEAPPDAPPADGETDGATDGEAPSAEQTPDGEGEEVEVGSQEWYRRDREAFAAAYPDVPLEGLVRDPAFTLYSEGKVGRLPMAEIYRGFRRLEEELEGRARQRAAQTVANRMASPGTLGSAGSAESDYFSAEQVRAMSPHEVRENYDKIRRSMAKW